MFPAKGQEFSCQPHRRAVKLVQKRFGAQANLETWETPIVNDSTLKFLNMEDCIYSIAQSGEILGYLLSTRTKGRYDYFDYSIVYSTELEILELFVTVYRSDHGIGICQKKWLSQFKGYQGGKLEFGTDIDAVSGGTISANALTRDVQRCHLLMSSLVSL